MGEDKCNCCDDQEIRKDHEECCNADGSNVDTDECTDDDEWACILDFVDSSYSYELSASEALYGFYGWLSTRKKATKISSKCDPGKICRLIERFIKANNLEHPREGWAQYLKHPKK